MEKTQNEKEYMLIEHNRKSNKTDIHTFGYDDMVTLVSEHLSPEQSWLLHIEPGQSGCILWPNGYMTLVRIK